MSAPPPPTPLSQAFRAVRRLVSRRREVQECPLGRALNESRSHPQFCGGGPVFLSSCSFCTQAPAVWNLPFWTLGSPVPLQSRSVS